MYAECICNSVLIVGPSFNFSQCKLKKIIYICILSKIKDLRRRKFLQCFFFFVVHIIYLLISKVYKSECISECTSLQFHGALCSIMTMSHIWTCECPDESLVEVQLALNRWQTSTTTASSSPVATLPYLSDSAGLYLRPLNARFSHCGPSYLHTWNGWSCCGMVLLPVVTTVNMGAQCLEAIRFVHVLLYLTISRNPLDPFPAPLVLPSLSPCLCPFFCRR